MMHLYKPATPSLRVDTNPFLGENVIDATIHDYTMHYGRYAS